MPRNAPEGPFTDETQEVGAIERSYVQLIKLLVRRMSRPEEVMVMENDDGEIVRVETKDTDCSALYKVMKETLVLLSSVDYEITEAIFMSSLDDEVERAWRLMRSRCRRATTCPSATRCSRWCGRSEA